MKKLTIEQKEALKKARREAYLAMKKKRDNDPAYIAFKEAQKQKKKEIYDQIKNRRNAEKKAKKEQERREKQEELLKMVGRATDFNSPKPNSREEF